MLEYIMLYLCISILEFKDNVDPVPENMSKIYVFLYQNLKVVNLFSTNSGGAFMYFYIRI